MYCVYDWREEIARETLRYNRSVNREYKTERGLWNNQHSGSKEISHVRETALREAIAEYERMNDWN